VTRADDRPQVTAPPLGAVTSVLDRLYPPAGAESWDAVGLVCGDPEQPVRRVLLAVDPTSAVVDQALDWGADLLVVHHPLLLRGVHGVPASTPKGRIVHRLVRAGCALFVAHTNADSARQGVSDALGRALGLADLRPLRPRGAQALDKVVAFVPTADAERLVDALSGAGAGAIGDYTRCAWTTTGSGTFRPEPGAEPSVGVVGEVARVIEARVEMVLPRSRRDDVVAALRATHPYEEPAFDVVELAELAGDRGSTGLGRVGELHAPLTLEQLATRVATALPPTVQGVRASGPADAVVRRVAVCGGAGDDLFDEVRASGADAYVTADLRHHPASEAREAAGDGPPYLVDVAHWASEWPWLADCERGIRSALAEQGSTVGTRVSTARTDPWTLHVPNRGGPS
jgi:dinuclear metal center YbgI/SA1388 family protein